MKKNTKSNTTNTGVTSGSHLIVTHNNDGSVDMKWNWDKLLEEVQVATAVKSRDLVAETEVKVKKTRSKKK